MYPQLLYFARMLKLVICSTLIARIMKNLMKKIATATWRTSYLYCKASASSSVSRKSSTILVEVYIGLMGITFI